MDKRRELIGKLSSKISSNEEKIKNLYIDIGDKLSSLGQKNFTNTPIATLYKDVKKMQTSLKTYQKQIERIEEITERIEEIRNERQALEENVADIEKQNIPLYGRIGETAFKVYKETPAQFHEYADIFSSVMEHKNEILQMERDIDAIDSNQTERSFFEKLKDKGQAALLKGKRMVRMRTTNKHFQEIGEKLCNTNFFDAAESEELQKEVGPYRQNQNNIAQLEDQKKDLLKEQEKLNLELQDIAGEARPQKKIDELRVIIRDEEKNLNQILERMGTVYFKSKPEEIPADDQIEKVTAEIKQIEDEITAAQESIKKLEASLEADRLGEDIKRMEKNIASLQEDIKRSEERIDHLQHEIGQTQKEKEKLEKIRGAEEDLPAE
jgi:predicted  nucleic acid-binding Zn-ribbon protein